MLHLEQNRHMMTALLGKLLSSPTHASHEQPPLSWVLSVVPAAWYSPRTGGKHPTLCKGTAHCNLLPTSPPQSHPATGHSFPDVAVLVFASAPQPLQAWPVREEEGGCRPEGRNSLAGTHTTKPRNGTQLCPQAMQTVLQDKARSSDLSGITWQSSSTS